MEMRCFVWNHIYYGISGGKISSFEQDQLMIPKVDSINGIKGFILSVEYALAKAEKSDEIKKKHNKIFSKDIDKLIDEVDIQIEELEWKEGWVAEHLPDDNKKIPFLEEVELNYTEYQLCDENKIHFLKEFCRVLEEELEIDSDRELTYLLLNSISYANSLFLDDIFPSNAFLSDLSTVYKQLEEEKKVLFRAELCMDSGKKYSVNGLNNFYGLDNSFSMVDGKIIKFVNADIVEKNGVANEITDKSICKRIGWVGYQEDIDEVSVLYAEYIPYGEIVQLSEMHSSIRESIIPKENKKKIKIAELYFSLEKKDYCLVNKEKIPVRPLLRAIYNLEGGFIKARIETGEEIEESSLKRVEEDDDQFSFHMENNNYRIPPYADKMYVGYAKVVGDTLSVFRFEPGKKIDNEVLFEWEVTYDYKIEKDRQRRNHVIESEYLDMKVINILIRSFGIKHWKWKKISF